MNRTIFCILTVILSLVFTGCESVDSLESSIYSLLSEFGIDSEQPSAGLDEDNELIDRVIPSISPIANDDIESERYTVEQNENSGEFFTDLLMQLLPNHIWASNGYRLSSTEYYRFFSDGRFEIMHSLGGYISEGTYAFESESVVKLEYNTPESTYDILTFIAEENILQSSTRKSLAEQDYTDNQGNYVPEEYVTYQLSPITKEDPVWESLNSVWYIPEYFSIPFIGEGVDSETNQTVLLYYLDPAEHFFEVSEITDVSAFLNGHEVDIKVRTNGIKSMNETSLSFPHGSVGDVIIAIPDYVESYNDVPISITMSLRLQNERLVYQNWITSIVYEIQETRNSKDAEISDVEGNESVFSDADKRQMIEALYFYLGEVSYPAFCIDSTYGFDYDFSYDNPIRVRIKGDPTLNEIVSSFRDKAATYISGDMLNDIINEIPQYIYSTTNGQTYLIQNLMGIPDLATDSFEFSTEGEEAEVYCLYYNYWEKSDKPDAIAIFIHEDGRLRLRYVNSIQ